MCVALKAWLKNKREYSWESKKLSEEIRHFATSTAWEEHADSNVILQDEVHKVLPAFKCLLNMNQRQPRSTRIKGELLGWKVNTGGIGCSLVQHQEKSIYLQNELGSHCLMPQEQSTVLSSVVFINHNSLFTWICSHDCSGYSDHLGAKASSGKLRRLGEGMQGSSWNAGSVLLEAVPVVPHANVWINIQLCVFDRQQCRYE